MPILVICASSAPSLALALHIKLSGTVLAEVPVPNNSEQGTAVKLYHEGAAEERLPPHPDMSCLI